MSVCVKCAPKLAVIIDHLSSFIYQECSWMVFSWVCVKYAPKHAVIIDIDHLSKLYIESSRGWFSSFSHENPYWWLSKWNLTKWISGLILAEASKVPLKRREFFFFCRWEPRWCCILMDPARSGSVDSVAVAILFFSSWKTFLRNPNLWNIPSRI